eukprot:3782968-Pyramimonas_sp.AAC.1
MAPRQCVHIGPEKLTHRDGQWLRIIADSASASTEEAQAVLVPPTAPATVPSEHREYCDAAGAVGGD